MRDNLQARVRTKEAERLAVGEHPVERVVPLAEQLGDILQKPRQGDVNGVTAGLGGGQWSRAPFVRCRPRTAALSPAYYRLKHALTRPELARTEPHRGDPMPET